MKFEIYLSLGLIALTIILFLLWRRAVLLLKESKFAKRSLSCKYGKISEQFMPFLANFPYNHSNFRFLGTPVDGVQFEEDKIILIEFKTANSRLTTTQKQIRDLVERGRVFFEEVRIK
jgi:predicted Holliday junction resolvase-like endonuclease